MSDPATSSACTGRAPSASSSPGSARSTRGGSDRCPRSHRGGSIPLRWCRTGSRWSGRGRDTRSSAPRRPPRSCCSRDRASDGGGSAEGAGLAGTTLPAPAAAVLIAVLVTVFGGYAASALLIEPAGPPVSVGGVVRVQPLSGRLDLYYRLSIIQIDIPPLRERGDDVLLLTKHYIETIGSRLRLRKKITGLSPEVVEVFRGYNWPGNVRELRNVIERTLILEDNDTITTEYLPGSLLGPVRRDGGPTIPGDLSSVMFTLPSDGISLDEAELSFVQQAIERSGGNQTRAAELLGISRDQLRYRLKKLEEVRGRPAGSESAVS